MRIEKSKIWLITDTHFNHKKLIEYGRPPDFEERIKKNLLSRIRPLDILIHLGDICIGKEKESSNWFKENLGCRTILCYGNHDGEKMRWYMDNGWDVALKRMDIKIYGKRIAFTHIPIAWDGYFDFNIHGHFHNTDHRRRDPFFNSILTGYNKLLAIEYTDYKPIELKKFINL
jgi:calcineurin-like phosphoesterase family protein